MNWVTHFIAISAFVYMHMCNWHCDVTLMPDICSQCPTLASSCLSVMWCVETLIDSESVGKWHGTDAVWTELQLVEIPQNRKLAEKRVISRTLTKHVVRIYPRVMIWRTEGYFDVRTTLCLRVWTSDHPVLTDEKELPAMKYNGVPLPDSWLNRSLLHSWMAGWTGIALEVQQEVG